MAKSKVISSNSIDDSEWQTESDLRTLMEAEKIEKDPKRMKAAQNMAKHKLLDLAGIAAEGDHEKK